MTKKNNNSIELKTGLAEMLKGGVIMDVVTPDQAKIAEDAGAIAVMALERVPSDIRAQGGVARMSPPELVESIMKCVDIPVMAKCRIGHFAEAQILQEIGVDYIDESEVLTPADEEYHINKHTFAVPFVCGATDLGEAIRRIGEGAALIRTKGEPGTGNIVEAVRHLRQINAEIRAIISMPEDEIMTAAKEIGAPYEIMMRIKKEGRLPVPNFAAGGVSTPADAALVMQLGAESVFVGSGIFKAEDPVAFAKAIVKATARFEHPKELLDASRDLPKPMEGLEISKIADSELMAKRGW
ncbi:MAG: pyridoxal 5'-phosphate synthase lyase subunit PdxS [Alphaproteobacteria bacterium]|nr:pyridoxal 5'-phosphate synthase lyase subunit PdxS [Alphaproteobacteria bacterium]